MKTSLLSRCLLFVAVALAAPAQSPQFVNGSFEQYSGTPNANGYTGITLLTSLSGWNLSQVGALNTLYVSPTYTAAAGQACARLLGGQDRMSQTVSGFVVGQSYTLSVKAAPGGTWDPGQQRWFGSPGAGFRVNANLAVLMDIANVGPSQTVVGSPQPFTFQTYQQTFVASATAITFDFELVTSFNNGLVALDEIQLSTSGPDLATGLVGYWPFDGDNLDHSGNSNHGAWNGGGFSSGKVGQGYQFAPGTFFTVPGSSTLNDFDTQTIATWVKIDSIPTDNGALISKGSDDFGKSSYGLWVSGITDSFFRWGYSQNQAVPLGTQPGVAVIPQMRGNWHHLVVVYDGDYARTYLDGAPTGAPRAAIGLTRTLGTDALYINRNDYWGTYSSRIGGAIDEVRVYNRALSAAEIQALYSSNSGGGGGDDCAQLQQALNDALAALAAANAQVTSLTAERAALSTQVTALQQQLATRTTERDTSQALAAQLQQQLTAITAQRDALQAQVAQLQAQLATAEANNGQLQSQLTAAQIQIATLTVQAAMLQEQLAAANGSLSAIDAALAAVEAEFRQEFSNPAFVIPGNSTAERVQALANAVILLNRGRTQGIYDGLK